MHSPFLKAQTCSWRHTSAIVRTDRGSTVLNRITIACLTLAGIIHLLPLPGVLGAGQLTRLYGVATDDPNVGILLQHRAVLFGLLGVLLIAAVFRPEFRVVALVAGLVSTVSFLVIAWSAGGYNPQLGRVVAADLVGMDRIGRELITKATLDRMARSPLP
jgi:hypothetical protein